MGILIPIIIVVLSFAVFVLLHLFLWKFKPKSYSSVEAVILICILSILSYLFVIGIIHFCTMVHAGSHFWVSFPTILFSMMLYLHFYMGIDRSVSIRLMGDILNVTDQKLNINMLKDAYSEEYMVAPRLDLLENSGFIKKINDEYICTNKGRVLAKCALMIRRIYSPICTK